MTNLEQNRVLCRRGARELTANETELIIGAAAFNTQVCTDAIFGALTGTTTGPGDGDGCGDHDSDHT